MTWHAGSIQDAVALWHAFCNGFGGVSPTNAAIQQGVPFALELRGIHIKAVTALLTEHLFHHSMQQLPDMSRLSARKPLFKLLLSLTGFSSPLV